MSASRFALVLAVGLVVTGGPSGPKVLSGQAIEVRGLGTVSFGGDRCANGAGARRDECQQPTAADQELAVRYAILQGMDTYLASRGNAESSLWGRLKSELGDGVFDYMIESQILSESVSEEGGVLSITARARVDWDGLVATATADRQSGEYIGMVFVVRAQSNITMFDDQVRTLETTDRTSDVSADSAAASVLAQTGTSFRSSVVDSVARNREDTGLTGGTVILEDSVRTSAIGADSMSLAAATSLNASVQVTTREQDRVETVTGGSVTRRRDEVRWEVGTSPSVTAVVSGVLTDAQFEPIQADFFEDALDPPLLETVRAEFASGEELSGAILRRLVAAAREFEIPYLLVGLVDEGLAEIDPISGSTRAMAIVTATVYDIRGRLPRTLLAVGPEAHAGLGPDHQVALLNAMERAAQAAASATVVRLIGNSR